MTELIPLNNDEIEVACDLHWFVERESGLAGVLGRRGNGLKPIRDGDYGGSAVSDLSTEEALPSSTPPSSRSGVSRSTRMKPRS